MQLPKLTPKQQQILIHIYKYRFLNRIQIQTLMNHKDYRRINEWLSDLTEKQYIERIYSTDFTERTKPAIYYLALNGIRLLKVSDYLPVAELRKRYREPKLSEGFRKRSMLIADCCIELQAQNSKAIHYECYTQADYSNGHNQYGFLNGEYALQPHLCYTKQQSSSTATHLLEVFDASLPRYKVRSRIKQADGSVPTILFVLPRLTDLIYAKRRIKKLLEGEWEPTDIDIRLITIDTLRAKGVRGDSWESVKVS
jgi:hypothetical protein